MQAIKIITLFMCYGLPILVSAAQAEYANLDVVHKDLRYLQTVEEYVGKLQKAANGAEVVVLHDNLYVKQSEFDFQNPQSYLRTIYLDKQFKKIPAWSDIANFAGLGILSSHSNQILWDCNQQSCNEILTKIASARKKLHKLARTPINKKDTIEHKEDAHAH